MRYLKKTISILIILALVLCGTGCTNFKEDSTVDLKNLKFYNDLDSRKELYKEYPAQFSNPEYQAIADEMYLTFAKRGTQEPEPVIIEDERGYIKPLGDGYYQFFEIEEYDGYKVGKNKLVNDEGVSMLKSPLTEYTYYDNSGNVDEVKLEYIDGSQTIYKYYVDMLGNPKIKQEHYESNCSNGSLCISSGIYYGDNSISYLDAVYEYEDGSTKEHKYTCEYENEKLLTLTYAEEDDYVVVNNYTYPSAKILEKNTTSSHNNNVLDNTYRKYYNGFIIEIIDYNLDGTPSHTSEFYYDNNGLVTAIDYYDNDEYLYTKFFVYDFENAIIYTYAIYDGYEIIEKNEMEIAHSSVSQIELFERINLKFDNQDFNPKNSFMIYGGLR